MASQACTQGLSTSQPADAAQTPPANAPSLATTPEPAATVPTSPTWHEHIAPLVSRSCLGCHQSGGVAPFSLESYVRAKPLAATLADRVKRGIMPPWGAHETPDCKQRLPWKDDIRLSEVQKKTFEAWAQAGAPEGDPAKAAPLPRPIATDLVGRTLRTTMPKPYAVKGTQDLFRCFSLPYTFEKETYITGVQVIPGNTKVVHHVLVWLDEKGQGPTKDTDGSGYDCPAHPGVPAVHITPWAPGAEALNLPEGVGLRAQKGARLIINIHYHPAATVETDATSIDLRLTDTRPPWEGVIALIGNFSKAQDGDGQLLPGPNDRKGTPEFHIPAGARGHTETMTWKMPLSASLPPTFRLMGVGTHMHYVGTDMRIDIDRSARSGGAPAGEPEKECLIQTPRWDFNWQRGYGFDLPVEKMPTLAVGDLLKFRCVYDNSMENPHVRQALDEQKLTAPHDVRLGEQTLDEMCLGAIGVVFPSGLRR